MLSEKVLIFLLSLVPTIIWSIASILYVNGVAINLYFEIVLTWVGWLITGIVVTLGYRRLKHSSHKEREIIALCCFINFLIFYISKEFRPNTDSTHLSVQYGIAEAFMVINAIYFSPILLSVFEDNTKLREMKKG